MKKLILSAALIAMTAFVGYAQSLTYAGNLGGGTAAVPAATTNTYWSTVLLTNITSSYNGTNYVYTTNVVSSIQNSAGFNPVLYSRMVSIQPSFALTGNGTTAIPITFDNSVDAIHWNIGATNMSVTPNGTNNVTAILTLDTGGVIYWRVGTVGDPAANTGAITNLAVVMGKRNGL